ncbi:MAG: M48 family metallopeptidase [Myxococcales bacterium]|nr:M48 family metallopeptidase [Myxococcales bacterium]
MAATPSIVARAVLALVLMVLFFVAAAGAVVALVLAGKFLLELAAEIHGRGILFIGLAALACFGAAAVVAWSVLPRPDRFEPPGPEISANRQPTLFAELRRVAVATGEAMPAHVYVVNDVNAFVTQRGGIMGLGSRRVMGLGMPLLRTLTVSELRAVVAHEMGHFYGGDTKLGPWIYKTRGAMVRTVVNLSKAGAEAGSVHELIPLMFGAIRAPFLWLGQGLPAGVAGGEPRAGVLGRRRRGAHRGGAGADQRPQEDPRRGAGPPAVPAERGRADARAGRAAADR